MGIWRRIRELPNQKMLVVVACLLGVFGVLGPSSFTQLFNTSIGSIVGGLMLAWSIAALRMYSSSQNIMDHFYSLVLTGTGPTIGYSFWFLMILLGLLRWLTQF